MYRVIATNAALAIAALPALVLAQSAPAEDAVVITASRTEQPLRDAIPHTTILTRKDISDSQAVDLPSLLQREAGFEYTQNGRSEERRGGNECTVLCRSRWATT